MRIKSCIVFIGLLCWQAFIHDTKAQKNQLTVDSLNYAELMYEAILKPDTLTFDSLLFSGLNVDCATNEGVTALMFASEQGNILFMNKLINAGANVNLLPNNGISALQSAIRAGKLEAVKLLLLNGASLVLIDKYGNTPLLNAAHTNNTAMVELLLTYDADINLVNHNGNSALHYAAEYGNDSLVVLLIESGLSVNTSNVQGITPLMAATQNNFTETAEFLVSYGADLNRVNEDNYSTLTFAIMNGNAYLAELFLLNGADNTHLQNKAKNHWYIAQGTGAEMKKVLREYLVKRNVKPVIEDFVAGVQIRMADSHLETAVLLGLRETKYNFLLQTSFGATPFVYSSLEKINQLTYQFWERNYWFALELDKFIAIAKSYRNEFGVFGGMEAEYRFGSYRGTKIKPRSEINFMPVSGLYFRKNYGEIKAGYTFGSGEEISGKIGLQLHFYISRALNETEL